MKKIIALALVLVMLFALTACGKEEAPVATEAPVVETEAPVEAAPELTPEPSPEPTPEPDPVGIEPDSGMYTFKSDVNGISFEFDSKYVAMQNPFGNVSVFAGTDAELPFCTVSLIADSDAVGYLSSLVEGVGIELGDAIVSAPADPAEETVGGKEVTSIYYTYNDEDAGGVIACYYCAQNMDDGSVAVFSYTALEEDLAVVDEIIVHAIETFALAK